VEKTLTLLAVLLTTTSASAFTVQSKKTGAKANVAASAGPRFQAYIDDLEAHGAVIRFMGGYRKGHGSLRHLHPWGLALDVCQLSRGRVDSRCHIPRPSVVAAIAARHGLFEGGQWCNSDYGHVQARMSAGACGTRLASRRHQHFAVAEEATYRPPNF